MAKVTKKSAQKRAPVKKSRAALRATRIALKPHSLMAFVLLGLVACSSDHSGGGRGSRVSSSGSDGYSPYGGTENPTAVKLGKAYSVNGTTYYPRHEEHYSETGIASWYGPTFHGRQTASGEKYDQHEMTAAHRTLPLPSMVRVTRLDTGASVVLRVNDRGPFSSNRILDMSKEAASELDMIRDGTAKVKVEYLPAETRQYIASLGLDVPDYMMADASESKNLAIKTGSAAAAPSFKMAQSHNNAGVIKARELPVAKAQPVRVASLAPVKPVPVKQETEVAKPVPVKEVRVASAALPHATPAPERQNTVRIAFHPGKPSAPLDHVSFTPTAPTPQFKATPAVMMSEGGVQRFKVQTAAFGSFTNAQRHVEELHGIGQARIMPFEAGTGTMYRVVMPVNGYNQAMSLLRQTKDMGYKDARIMVE
jgi:rare lipoprotein A